MITGTQDFIRQWSQVHPEHIALAHPSQGQKLSYRQLNQRADQGARALAELGVQKGDRVIILARNCIAQFELIFACWRLGATYTPLNWRLAGEELAEIAEHCQARLLVFDALSFDLAQSISQRVEIKQLCLDTHNLTTSEEIMGYEALLAKHEAVLDQDIEALISQTHEAETIAMMLYTSGTTGRPKGVMLPHRQIFWNAVNTVFACDLSPQDRSLAFLPMFHTGGLNCLATPSLYRGGQVVLMDAFDPKQALEIMQAQKITAVVAVPAMYQMLLDAGMDAFDLRSLRTLLCGGAPLPDSLLDAWLERGFAFRQGFGMTEIGPNCFSLPSHKVDEKRGSIGQVVLHAEAKIIDESGETLGVGEVGELCLGGPIISAGYFNDAEATAKSYVNGWLRTGDLARYDDEGFFYISGRKKEMYISGGENVYPAEIENVLLLHPQVNEATVVGVADERWGEVGLAAIVPVKGVELSDTDLKSWCQERLARFKIPKHFRYLSELPRNASAKVIKAQIKELL